MEKPLQILSVLIPAEQVLLEIHLSLEKVPFRVSLPGGSEIHLLNGPPGAFEQKPTVSNSNHLYQNDVKLRLHSGAHLQQVTGLRNDMFL